MCAINTLPEKFYDLFYTKEWPGTLSPGISDVSIAEAYQIQDLVAQKRIEKGEKTVGFKVGCTSTAIRTQFGLQEPICGRLFTPHVYEEGVQLDWNDYVNCGIEPEMVLKIGKDLAAQNLPDDQLIDAIDYVSPGIEIHHFKFWFSPPSSQELICSGGIHAGLVIGDQKVSPEKVSFESETFSVYKDDDLITEAPASEIMGGPLKSLRWLVNFLVRRGQYIKKDSFVISGSPVELASITKDTRLKIEIECVGSLTTEFKIG